MMHTCGRCTVSARSSNSSWAEGAIGLATQLALQVPGCGTADPPDPQNEFPEGGSLDRNREEPGDGGAHDEYEPLFMPRAEGGEQRPND